MNPNECMWCFEPIEPGEYRINYGIDLETTVEAHADCHATMGPPERPGWRIA